MKDKDLKQQLKEKEKNESVLRISRDKRTWNMRLLAFTQTRMLMNQENTLKECKDKWLMIEKKLIEEGKK